MTNGNHTTKCKYFSIHSMNALKRGQFSVVCGNVKNNDENIELFKSIFPENEYHLEFHHSKIDMRWVIL
jgi:hypothetical protein